MRVAMRVSSASFAGSRGGGIGDNCLRSDNARAVSGRIGLPSKRRDCSIQPSRCASQRSLAFAASSSVSLVMYVDDTHCAALSSE